MTHSKSIYPKEIQENKRYRLQVLQQAEHNPELQVLLRERCLRDILFFVNVFGWTYDPRREPSQIPFITYEYQDDTLLKLVACIEHEKDCAIEKSRDMGASWMMVALQVYGFLVGWSSLYGSYKEDYVDSVGDMDSHFERIRFFIEMLPTWLQPRDISSTFMSISSQETKCGISGDAGQNFGTGGRRKFVIMDEFALWQHDKKAFRKTKDISRCHIYLGTPEGKYNVYGQMMTRTGEFENLDIVRIRLHWSLHPLKTQEWYEAEKRKRTAIDIAKELDISYEDSVTGAVYPEFNERVSITTTQFNPSLPLFTSWDFGRDMNAIIWFQKDWYTNRVYAIDAYQVPNKPIEFMAAFITGEPSIDPVTGLPYVYDDEEMRMIDRHRDWKDAYAMHCGDPYNASSLQTNAQSSIKQILRTFGIEIVTKTKTSLEERIRKTHLLLPRLTVDKNLLYVIQAMTQSRYPEDTKSMTREKTKPIHDVYSHSRTAMEYFADNEPSVNPFKEKKEKHTTENINYLTGQAY